MDFSTTHRMCSFCGTQGLPETVFVGGLGAMMCLDCLDRFHASVHSPEQLAELRLPPWETMSDAELLDTLPLILRTSEQVASFAAEWVALIRSRGISWTAVGKALGVSRQAAAQRFGKAGLPAAHANET